MSAIMAKDVGAILERGQWWRLFSYPLMHIGWSHLLANLPWLLLLGWLTENAYGRVIATFLAMVSVLGGGLLSLAFGVGPTIGTSALVFGWFGVAIGFGWKYNELVVPGDRARFGWALTPYLLALLFLGFSVPSIDNATHLGAAFTGLIVALSVPSIWEIPDARVRRELLRWTGVGAGVLALFILGGPLIGGPLRGGPLPPLSTVGNDEAGYSLKVPTYWQEGVDFLGFEIVRNPSGDAIFGHAVVLHKSKPATVNAGWELADELLAHDDLFVDSVETTQHPVSVAGHQAVEGCVTFFRGANGYRSCRVSIVRGRSELQLALRVPLGMERSYRQLWERILATTSWNEPAPLARARERVDEHPEKWTAHIDLAREFMSIGMYEEAWAEAISVKDQSEGSEHVDRILLEIALEGAIVGEEVVGLALLAPGRHPNDPAIVLLSQEILDSAGHVSDALRLLETARDRFPVNEAINNRISVLRQRLGMSTPELQP